MGCVSEGQRVAHLQATWSRSFSGATGSSLWVGHLLWSTGICKWIFLYLSFCIYCCWRSPLSFRLASFFFQQLRAGLHHEPWRQTMEGGLFPWSDLVVQLPWSAFLKNQFTKPSGPSLGVNQMWTKRNDHAPKNWMCSLFKYMPEKGIFEKNQVWPCSCLLFPKQILLNFYYNNISLKGAPFFFYHSTSFASPS
jgi:hypothetical protein